MSRGRRGDSGRLGGSLRDDRFAIFGTHQLRVRDSAYELAADAARRRVPRHSLGAARDVGSAALALRDAAHEGALIAVGRGDPIADNAAAAWGQNYHGESVHYNGCDAAIWLFHGTPRDLSHNMSHVDGHVKTHSIPFLPWGSSSGGPWMEVYDNDQYRLSMGPYAWE